MEDLDALSARLHELDEALAPVEIEADLLRAQIGASHRERSGGGLVDISEEGKRERAPLYERLHQLAFDHGKQRQGRIRLRARLRAAERQERAA